MHGQWVNLVLFVCLFVFVFVFVFNFFSCPIGEKMLGYQYNTHLRHNSSLKRQRRLGNIPSVKTLQADHTSENLGNNTVWIGHMFLTLKLCTSPCVLVFWTKMLAQELMIRKCEDVETKNSCWAGELVKI